jgi:hypothetical protein
VGAIIGICSGYQAIMCLSLPSLLGEGAERSETHEGDTPNLAMLRNLLHPTHYARHFLPKEKEERVKTLKISQKTALIFKISPFWVTRVI